MYGTEEVLVEETCRDFYIVDACFGDGFAECFFSELSVKEAIASSEIAEMKTFHFCTVFLADGNEFCIVAAVEKLLSRRFMVKREGRQTFYLTGVRRNCQFERRKLQRNEEAYDDSYK